MPKTRLNTTQLDTLGVNDITSDAELSAAILAHKNDIDAHPQYQDLANTYVELNKVGVANGVAELDSDRRIPVSQIPNHINQFLTYANLAALPTIGDTGKYYITLDNNQHYEYYNGGYGLAQFGWKDKEGDVTPRNTGTFAPTLKPFTSTYITEYAYAAGDRCDLRFHVPHDYVPHTDLFVHVHWSHSGTAIANELQIKLRSTYAKGHQQASFHPDVLNTIDVTGLNITNTPKYFHRVDEIQLSCKGGSANLLNTDILEIDGFILFSLEVTIIPSITGSAYTNAPYIIGMDIHYQSTDMSTKNKSPNFYI